MGPPLGLLFQALHHHARERRRNREVRPSVEKRLGRCADMGQQQAHGSVGFEGKLSGEHLVKNDSQRIKVRPTVEFPAPPPQSLFRRHVLRRTDDHAGAGEREAGGSVSPRFVELGDAEVKHLGLLGFRRLNKYDVGRLDVAVYQADRMRSAEPGSNLAGNRGSASRGQGASIANQFLQALPLDVFHHHERAAVLGLVDIVDTHGVRVVQLACHHRFLLETFYQQLVTN